MKGSVFNQAFISALTCNIVTFITGTALTWSSPVLPKLNSSDIDTIPFRPTIEESSWISSLLTVGAIFGPFFYGFLVDKIGRKLTITLLGVPHLIAYLILSFSRIVELYYVARFTSGVAVGGTFTVVPMYIAEIAEDANRGTLSSTMNVLVTGGLFFPYAVGPFMNIKSFNLLLAVVPALFIILFFVFALESPYYHIAKGNDKAASYCLDKLRGTTKNENELNDIKKAIEKSKKGTIFDLFKTKGLIKAIVISMSLVGFQQLSGNNAVLFYAQTIFESSGSSLSPEISSIIVGAVFFFTSFVTPLFVDRLGRKILLYFSAVGMVLAQVPLGLYFHLKDNGHDVSDISWLPIVSMVVYIVTYNSGFGPLPWTIMGELFPSNVKSIASSMTSAFCWFLGFNITKFFHSIVTHIGMGTPFWIFAGFCILSFFFTFFYVIETKGKSLQQIQEELEA